MTPYSFRIESCPDHAGYTLVYLTGDVGSRILEEARRVTGAQVVDQVRGSCALATSAQIEEFIPGCAMIVYHAPMSAASDLLTELHRRSWQTPLNSARRARLQDRPGHASQIRRGI